MVGTYLTYMISVYDYIYILCPPPFINDYPQHSQMRHTLPGDNYTIIALQSNEGVKDF